MPTSKILVDGVAYQGELIGQGSSHQGRHTHQGDYLPAGKRIGGAKVRCPACRWQEVLIYAVGEEHYLVLNTGHTIVPGETPYKDHVYTRHAYEVLEHLTVRNREGAFLPGPARIALAQSASDDEELERVYRNLPAGL